MEDCWQFNVHKGKNTREPFAQRVLNLSEDLNYNVEQLFMTTPMPLWHYETAVVSTELTDYISKSDNILYQRQRSLELINQKWANYLHMYTDGSKSPDKGKVAAAFYVPHYNHVESKRLQDNTSSYRAELIAIVLTLHWLNQLPCLHTGAVIFSDSPSAMQAIKNDLEEQIIYEILMLYTNLHHEGTQVYFEWIPGHCEIHPNEVVDRAAKQALTHNQVEVQNQLIKSESNSIIRFSANKANYISFTELCILYTYIFTCVPVNLYFPFSI